ncbi:MmgE/PrpD family protein [Paenibacillus sp. Pae108]|nr:MmgE/PrpD family protein [Paenibacillus sp. Pae108]
MDDVSRFCSSIGYEDLPAEVVKNAKKAIIDTHGVIFTGYEEPVTKILVEWVKQQSAAPKSTVLGYGFKTSESLAALLNGTMGHAIDFDDVHAGLRGHPSLPVYAAVLAVCEAENKIGRELIAAFAVGVEVMTKLGNYFNPSHNIRGWHPSATLGVIGAAAAAGKLYGFDQMQFKKVFGLASSMMSGLKINFGTMTKPYHIGYCARNGLEAAQLVSKGFTACEDSFSPRTGVFDLYTLEEPKDDWGSDLGHPWSLTEPGFNMKRYPCCHATFRFADAAYRMTQLSEVDPAEIIRIECVAAVGSFTPLIHNRPKTGIQGKFSLEYVVSAMLIDKKLTVHSFTDEMVNRPVIQQLIPKVMLIEDTTIKENRPAGDMGYAELIIYTNDQIMKEKVFHAKGSSQNPIDMDELERKFFDCLDYADFSAKSKEVYTALLALEEVNDIQKLICI